ncbi:MAG: Mur ligase domain-containing protein, partial [Bacillota bacterium]
MQPQARLHFIGIGGYGMSGLARVWFELGRPVSGSDARPSSRTRLLADLGIPVHIGHDPSHVDGAA